MQSGKVRMPQSRANRLGSPGFQKNNLCVSVIDATRVADTMGAASFQLGRCYLKTATRPACRPRVSRRHRAQPSCAPTGAAGPRDILSLQRAVGNRAVQRVLAQRAPDGPAPSGALNSGVVQRHAGPGANALSQTGQSQLDMAMNQLTGVGSLSQSASASVSGAKWLLQGAHAMASAEPCSQGGQQGQEEVVAPATGCW